MPELPEVETMVRGIRKAVEGARIVSFKRSACKCKPISPTPEFSQLAKRITGLKICAVTRLAKRIVMQLENEDSLVIEPRMTGLMLLADPPSVEHLRFCWELKQGRKQFDLFFWDRRGLGTLKLYSPEEFEQQLGENKLGPDALVITQKQWQQRLKKTSRPIKVAMLDQKLVAGIGNLYASEILHLAQISPLQPCDDISESQLNKLSKAVRQILNKAIKHEGSTLSDGTYRNALNQAGGYQNMHRVYGKESQICPTCGNATITRIVQAQRSTFFCSNCQP
ncbi:MAG: bifunctional DNA-formamidopyrimidine glycosylase/DNA-(apurinic or apyrimidinic site) lyase [Planctomycetaceae bacterium]|nr:bifunctional DNA-formamidopyrimidine glycosylase/DNA-(apurinic or apyrimidinic site) lyase [Planctomycetaceae bacterium]